MSLPTNDDRSAETAELARRSWLRARLPLESETALFILVNALDVFCTYLLLYRDTHREGNPIAAFFYHHWGLRGLIYFKFALVGLVCVIAQVVARYQLPTARRLLFITTAIVGAVVIYGVVQLVQHA